MSYSVVGVIVVVVVVVGGGGGGGGGDGCGGDGCGGECEVMMLTTMTTTMTLRIRHVVNTLLLLTLPMPSFKYH